MAQYFKVTVDIYYYEVKQNYLDDNIIVEVFIIIIDHSVWCAFKLFNIKRCISTSNCH